jgi:hypothetical protein
MKIYLFVLILFSTTVASAQNIFTLTGQTAPSSDLTALTEAHSTSVLRFIQTSNGRIAYHSQGDTVYFDLAKGEENESTPVQYIPADFYRTTSQFASGSSMTTTQTVLDSWGKSGVTNPQVLSGSTPIGQLLNDQTSYTISSVQPYYVKSLTESLSTTTQQFEVDSLVAYYSKNPGDGNAWLRGGAANSPEGSTTLSVWTASDAFPNNRNGAININVGNSAYFGISTDSLSGSVGWINNSQGIMTLRANTIFAAGDFIDSGLLSASKVAISDQPSGALTFPNGYQAFISSSSSLGAGFMIAANSDDATANATLTLMQGRYRNSIMTISAYSANPDRPSGAFAIDSYNGNMILSVLNEDNAKRSAISFELNSVLYARFDDAHGFSVYQHPFRLPNFSTKEMMALTGLEPGDEVFNTTLQTNCTYTGKEWKAEKMYVVK